jgi:hypothetical protein
MWMLRVLKKVGGLEPSSFSEVPPLVLLLAPPLVQLLAPPLVPLSVPVLVLVSVPLLVVPVLVRLWMFLAISARNRDLRQRKRSRQSRQSRQMM